MGAFGQVGSDMESSGGVKKQSAPSGQEDDINLFVPPGLGQFFISI